MVRQLITKIWCDICLDEGMEVEGIEIPETTLGNRKPRVLALCEPHRKEFYDPFEELLLKLGQVVGGESAPAREASSKIPCKVCGKLLKNENTIATHARTQHSMSKSQYDAFDADQQLPLDGGSQVAEVPVEERFNVQTCDQPDKDDPSKPCTAEYYEPKNQRPVQALGVHKARAHGIKGRGKG